MERWVYRYLCSVVMVIAGLIASLFVGIMHDGEFGESPIDFIKKRPSFQINFYPPHGQSDSYISDLPTAKQEEEELDYHMSESGEGINQILSPFQPLIIQFAVASIVIGIARFFQQLPNITIIRLAVFLIFGLVIQLLFRGLWWKITTGVGFGFLVTNFLLLIAIASYKRR